MTKSSSIIYFILKLDTENIITPTLSKIFATYMLLNKFDKNYLKSDHDLSRCIGCFEIKYEYFSNDINMYLPTIHSLI